MSYQEFFYAESTWAQKFAAADLANFEQLWQVQLPWVEEPNSRRGGWSGVVSGQLDAQDPSTLVYIKRQENHTYRPVTRPFSKLPTFHREARTILYLQMHGVPVVTPLFFDMQLNNKYQRAVFVTQALIGYRSLENLLDLWQREGLPNDMTCKAIVEKIAISIRKIHDLGIRHGAFKLKHIFINYDEAAKTSDVRLIDFEVARRVYRKRHRIMNDLASVYFKCRHLPARYFYHFLKCYLQIEKVTPEDFKLVQELRAFKSRRRISKTIRQALFHRNRLKLAGA